MVSRVRLDNFALMVVVWTAKKVNGKIPRLLNAKVLYGQYIFKQCCRFHCACTIVDAVKCDQTLWVVRKVEERVTYNTSYADTDSQPRKELTDALKKGVSTIAVYYSSS